MRDRRADAADPSTPRVYTARGHVDGEDWPAVARALNDRMAGLRLGQQELAQRSGVSVSTLRQLQHGAGRRVQNKTLSAISLALDWPEDHLTGVLLAGRRDVRPATTTDADPLLDILTRIEASLDQLTARLTSIEAMLRSAER